MKLKKIISAFMILCTVAGTVPFVPAKNADYQLTANAEEYGYFTYSGSTITGFNSSYTDKDITVLSVINEVPITSIAKEAFRNATHIEKITIPEGITSIGESAFYCCTSLTEVNLPESLTSINQSAFYNCSSLEQITLPDGIKAIGAYAFKKYTNMTKIKFPQSLSVISYQVAYGCTSLDSIYIQNGPTTIGSNAFTDCLKLRIVSIPKSIQSISYSSYNSFSNCNAIEKVYYAGNSLSWNNISGASNVFTDSNKIVFESSAPKPSNRKTGDINGDGLVDANDASVILSYYAYLSTGGTETDMNIWYNTEFIDK